MRLTCDPLALPNPTDQGQSVPTWVQLAPRLEIAHTTKLQMAPTMGSVEVKARIEITALRPSSTSNRSRFPGPGETVSEWAKLLGAQTMC